MSQLLTPSRRGFIQTVGSLGLAGCGLSPTLDLVSKTFAPVPKTDSGYAISVAQIKAIPYATLGIRVGGGDRGVMVLATADGDDLSWVSADRAILVTRAGRLVKTVGFPRDLRNTQYTAADPLAQIYATGAVDAAPSTWRYVDITSKTKNDFGLLIESSYSIVGTETLSILGAPHETTVIREEARVPAWRWKSKNLFWIDHATGTVRKARQQYCPEVAVMEYEILKPPAIVARSSPA